MVRSPRHAVRRVRALRDVDEHVAVLLGHRVARQTPGPILPAAVVDVESPAMIAAHERPAVDFAFAEERTLMRTTSLKGSQSLRAPHDHDIHAVGSHGMWSSSRERIRSRDAHSDEGAALVESTTVMARLYFLAALHNCVSPGPRT